MSRSPLEALTALLGVSADTPVVLQRLDVLDWGRTLVFTGLVSNKSFALRYEDCRELRWRVYAHELGGETPVVSFAPGRDQQRSPAQWLTGHFGLSLFYGSVKISV